MKKTTTALLFLLPLALGGCANNPYASNATTATAGGGALLGALAGAVIGNHTGAPLAGAAIGGGLGGLAGYAVGPRVRQLISQLIDITNSDFKTLI